MSCLAVDAAFAGAIASAVPSSKTVSQHKFNCCWKDDIYMFVKKGADMRNRRTKPKEILENTEWMNECVRNEWTTKN